MYSLVKAGIDRICFGIQSYLLIWSQLTSLRALIALLGLELESSLLVELSSCLELESEPSDIDLGDSGSLHS